jgi:hypothetical protein
MKKILGLLSSLLFFAGAKAQTPTVKKETTKPVVSKPATADSLKAIKGNANIKLTDKAIKIGQLKNGNTLPMKENALPIKQTIAKPDKH